SECQEAVRMSKKAYNKWKGHPSHEKLLEFKNLRAKARYVVKRSKRTSWENFVSTITPNTPSKEVWNKIKRIKGTRSQPGPRALLMNDELVSDANRIAEAFAEKFESASQDSNYDATFRKHKKQTELHSPSFDEQTPL